MKLYDGGKIIIGIIIFLGLITIPFYFNAGKAVAPPKPKLDTPVIQALAVKECVKPKEIMRAEHMRILDDWRNSVVREDDRQKIVLGGKEFAKSLQNGCLKCHSNKKDFCDKCHTYMAVNPYCWDCHFTPKENRS